jgi:hypothetical protein
VPAYKPQPYPQPLVDQRNSPISAAAFTPQIYTPGMPMVLWNAETVAANSASVQFCIRRYEHFAANMSVAFKFGGDPGAFQIDFQTADVDDDTQYITKASVLAGLNSSFAGRMEITNVVAKFARLYLVGIANAVPLTATVY